MTLETKLEWKGKNTPSGLNDDYLLNSKNEIVDLHSAELEWQKVQASSICNTQRAHQSGAITTQSQFSIPFVIECAQTLKIANDDQVFFEQKAQFASHGLLLRSF